MYECFILICQKKWFGDTETFCFSVTKTKYFDFLFWNKFCCLKTDLNFRKGFFKPALCNKKKEHFFSFWRKCLGLLIFPRSWIWQQNWKIHIHLPFSLLILMSHLQLLKESNAFIHQCITAITQHPCFRCAKRGLLKWSFVRAQKHGGIPGMCDHRWLGHPGTGHGHACLPHGHGCLRAPLHLGLPATRCSALIRALFSQAG